jgi:hypothetical protein
MVKLIGGNDSFLPWDGTSLKWKNHTSIARAISRELELPIILEDVLVEGSIDPDRYPDLMKKDRSDYHWRRVPHHSPTTSLIMNYVWRARKCIVEGEESIGMFNLGRALHYLQDRTVGFSTRRQHDRKERQIGDWDVDPQSIRSGIRDAVSSPRYVNRLVRGIKPTKQAGRAMRHACYDSAAMVAAVIGTREVPKGLAKKARRSRRINMVLLIIMCTLALFGIYNYLETNKLMFLGITSIAVVLAVASSAFRGRRKDEARWFGLE